MNREKTGLVFDDGSASLTAIYEPVAAPRPAILVLPGGGYNICAPSEGEPVARRFAELGYAAFLLNYSTRFGDPDAPHAQPNPHRLFPEPLIQTAAAVGYIRGHAGEYAVDTSRVVLLGFSAGGHLAANYCNLWSTPEIACGAADAEALRPNVCLLGYPAAELTSGSMSAEAIFDGTPTAEQLRRYSAKYSVSSLTPPTFLFHSLTDPQVPARMSLELSQALAAAGVPCELHLFGCGGHAWALGEGTPMGAWVAMADSFIRRVTSEPDAYNADAVRRASEARRRRQG